MPQRPPPTRGSGPESGHGYGSDPDPTGDPSDHPGTGERLVDARWQRTAVPDPYSPRDSRRPRSAPFVWQHERQVLLLDRACRGWIAAELQFDAEGCRYVEIRRATYRWPREAVGALLARTVALGEATANRLACDLDAWLTDRSFV